ncbi:MAG TPA: DUF4166 domain-containing protein [Planctomycetaceae bacterium]|nr:DUF4166 domain-containing protein [Planctomycetaceae bacterium]
MSSGSLYRRLLGSDFERLPGGLRRFHDCPDGGRGAGRFDVQRGPGLVARWLGWLLRLPRTGTGVPMTLQVSVEGGRERWLRDFDGRCLESIQWHERGALVERAGLLRLAFRVSADEAGMDFVSRRAWFTCVPLPGFLRPRVEASALAEGHGWRVRVRVWLPWGGLLVGYDGTVVPQSPRKPAVREGGQFD